ncbi:MAG TPA: right-handed parallel beta-helix repeat-containing protein [Thermoguttaceae bacterium]|nr:right-handed parallel beta-helix repeat-containing protein [Thermoguttaceae bacterium]
MRRVCSLGLALIVLITPAAGRDIYVSNTAGDDSFTGLQSKNVADRSGPVRTIARALQLGQSGDRIVLTKTGEPYRESVSLVGSRHSGYPHQAFVIDGNDAILDGSAPVPPEAWEHYRGAVFRFRPPKMGPQQLFIDDIPAERAIVDPTSGALPELQSRQWFFYAGYIYFCVERNKLPEDYRFTCAKLATGITLFHVRGVGIVNLTVQGFQVDGINAHNSAREVYLGRVTARGNGRAGVAVGGASQVEIDVSLIGNNGEAQVLTFPHSETVIRNSNVFSNPAPAWLDRGGRFFLGNQRVEGGIADRDVTADKPAP